MQSHCRAQTFGARKRSKLLRGRKPLNKACLPATPLAGANVWRVQTPRAVKRAAAPTVQL